MTKHRWVVSTANQQRCVKTNSAWLENIDLESHLDLGQYNPTVSSGCVSVRVCQVCVRDLHLGQHRLALSPHDDVVLHVLGELTDGEPRRRQQRRRDVVVRGRHRQVRVGCAGGRRVVALALVVPVQVS